MKYNITLILILTFQLLIFIHNSEAKDIGSKKIIPLFKNDTNSAKILAGTAIIRYKSGSNKTATNISQKEYKTIGHFIASECLASNNPNIINKFPVNQQKKILELEEILQRTVLVEFDDNIDVLSFCRNIASKHFNIELAEPYYVPKLLDIPNDQFALNQEVLSRIQAFEAWNINAGNEEVLIGISDNGVNWQHEDLIDAIAINENEILNDGIDNDNNGYIDDYYGYNFAWEDEINGNPNDVTSNGEHGTYVAGIIAARVNNGKGIAGVANKCKIVPIKIAAKQTYGEIIYSYLSFFYAITRGCKIINCSWGANEYSETNNLIISYAIACDVAVVAAGGNVNPQASIDSYTTFYPAGYFGVLGVGELDPGDKVRYNNVVYGVPVRIMAQSYNNYTVSGINSYPTISYSAGSSFATPVISGVVAITRSHFPQLSPIEAIELVRVSGDKIVSNFQNVNVDSAFIPLRTNLLKTLLNNPNETPSIIPIMHYTTNLIGKTQDRFDKDETFLLHIKLVNVLGNAKNVKLNLKEIYSLNSNAYLIKNPEIFIGNINHGDTVSIDTIQIVAKDPSITNIIYKGYLSSNIDNYNDAFKLELNLATDVTTFTNDKMVISVADRGSIGYNTSTKNSFGYGFTNIDLGNFIFQGGVIAVVPESGKSVSAVLDTSVSDRTSFIALKKLTKPEENISIIADNRTTAANKIGLNIETKYILPEGNKTAMKMYISAKNVTNKPIKGFSLGQFYDWDIGISVNSEKNKVEYCPECIPYELDTNYAAAEIAYDIEQTTYVGSLVMLDNTNNMQNLYVVPQAAGVITYPNSTIYKKSEQIAALTSGKSKQVNGIADIGYFIGMQFQDDFLPNDNLGCIICTAVESTKERLISILAECSKNDYGKVNINYDGANNSINIVQDKENIYITLLDDKLLINSTIEFFNIIGQKLLEIPVSERKHIVNISELPSSIYFIRLTHNDKHFVNKIAVIR